MLYYLTDSLIVDDAHPSYKQIVKSLKRLGLSVLDSNHLLTGDYKVLEYAAKIFKEDDELSPLYSRLAENYATQSIPTFITYYLEIVLDNPITRIQGQRTIAQILPADICKTENVTAASLIVEDVSDADFYSYVLKWYSITHNIVAHFHYNPVHGGGQRIVEVIEDELRRKHVSMTILDTDQRYPQYVYNIGTFKKCKKLGRNKVFYKFLPLCVHEIENLLPMNYIDMLDHWQTEAGAAQKKSFDYLKNDPEKVLPYFDLKKGIIKSKIIVNRDYYSFAEYCYSLNPDLGDGFLDFGEYVSSKGENDIIYSGLFNGIMKNVLNILKEPNMPSPVLYNFQFDNWNNIGANMVNWFIARNDESIIY